MKGILISIDGPSGAGKGMVCMMLSRRLGIPMLDSGAIYRSVAFLKDDQKIESVEKLARIVRSIRVVFRFKDQMIRVFLHGEDVTDALRTDQCAKMASKLASFPAIRESLFLVQRSFLTSKGLVADGRDMSSVIFPESNLKVYLTASLSVRAKRRYLDFKRMGMKVDFNEVYHLMKKRDQKDQRRVYAPLCLTQGSMLIDCSDISVHQVVSKILRRLTE